MIIGTTVSYKTGMVLFFLTSVLKFVVRLFGVFDTSKDKSHGFHNYTSPVQERSLLVENFVSHRIPRWEP